MPHPRAGRHALRHARQRAAAPVADTANMVRRTARTNTCLITPSWCRACGTIEISRYLAQADPGPPPGSGPSPTLTTYVPARKLQEVSPASMCGLESRCVCCAAQRHTTALRVHARSYVPARAAAPEKQLQPPLCPSQKVTLRYRARAASTGEALTRCVVVVRRSDTQQRYAYTRVATCPRARPHRRSSCSRRCAPRRR